MSKLTPTSEQVDAIKTETDVLVIEAGAGASKTTTLAMYAEARLKERMLYVAYNAAIRDEARHKFPSNVKVMTSHGIAYAAVGVHYEHKLGNLHAGIFRHELKLGQYLDGPKDIRLFMQVINDALAKFLSDTTTAPNYDHVKINRKIEALARLKPSTVVGILNTLWTRMQDTNDDKVPMTHDGYLKLFMLKGLSVGNYDRILFDEAQDANPVTLEIIQRSPGKKVFVGDRNQSIYKFRGAVDAMKNIPASQRRVLSGSFRFGSNIADAANRILAMKGSSNLIRGISGKEDKVLLPTSQEDYDNLAKDILCNKEYTDIALLAFNNQTVMDLALLAADAGRRAFFVGGIHNYRLSNLMDVYHLKYGGKVEDPVVAAFTDFESLKEYAETDIEMSQRIKMVERYGERLPDLLAKIQRIAVKQPSEAEVVISTVHKAKGLEFDTVILANDMQAFGLDYYYEYNAPADFNTEPSLAAKVETGEAFRKKIKDEEDPNLCYVAITRAKRCLLLPRNAIELYSSQRVTALLNDRKSKEPSPSPIAPVVATPAKPAVIEDTKPPAIAAAASNQAYQENVIEQMANVAALAREPAKSPQESVASPVMTNGSITTQEHRELRRSRYL